MDFEMVELKRSSSYFAKATLLILCVAAALACVFPRFAIAEEASPAADATEEASLLAGTTEQEAEQTKEEVTASITYAASAGGAWKWKSDGAESTVSKSAQVKALRLKVSSSLEGSVQYQVYVNGAGWQAAKADGKIAGHAAKGAQRFEAVRIALVGELSKQYDVRYSVLSSAGKWQAWKQNGQVAGKVGSKLRGIKVQLVKKSTASSSAGTGIVGVRYRVSMLGTSGWQMWKTNNAKAGKAGKGKRIKNLAIEIDKGSYTGSIKYRVRLASGKWKGWKSDGTTIGNLKNIEAIQIKLTGSLAKRYDVVYRTYASGVGWQARVRNGATAGTAKGRRIEGIRVQLVKKTKRSGWVGSGKSWAYYKSGKRVTSQWITTSESPINVLTSASHKYWIDSTGKLAVARIVNPKKSPDKGAGMQAYASKWGYIAVDDFFQIDGIWYIADESGVLTKASESNKLVESYVQWAIDTANDNSHGYSQDLERRWGNPDYDCSSFVISAVRSAGISTGNATWTGNMIGELTKYGFVWHSGTKGLRRGDILLVHNSSRQHTELYIGNKQTAGAHIAETGGIYGVGGDQTGHEIDVGPYYSSVGWQGYLRFGS